jgi:hypothetical protein
VSGQIVSCSHCQIIKTLFHRASLKLLFVQVGHDDINFGSSLPVPDIEAGGVLRLLETPNL